MSKKKVSQISSGSKRFCPNLGGVLPAPSLRLLRAAQVAEEEGMRASKNEEEEAPCLGACQEPLLPRRPTPKHSQEDALCCVAVPKTHRFLPLSQMPRDLFGAGTKDAQLGRGEEGVGGYLQS